MHTHYFPNISKGAHCSYSAGKKLSYHHHQGWQFDLLLRFSSYSYFSVMMCPTSFAEKKFKKEKENRSVSNDLATCLSINHLAWSPRVATHNSKMTDVKETSLDEIFAMLELLFQCTKVTATEKAQVLLRVIMKR